MNNINALLIGDKLAEGFYVGLRVFKYNNSTYSKMYSLSRGSNLQEPRYILL